MEERKNEENKILPHRNRRRYRYHRLLRLAAVGNEIDRRATNERTNGCDRLK